MDLDEQDKQAEELLAQELASGFWEDPERIAKMKALESQPYFTPITLPKPDKHPEVYFIQSDAGPIKIGHSDVGARSRLSQLQTSSPIGLKLLKVLPGTIKLERELHRKFAQYRLRGEWFQPSPELLEFIKKN
jgi:hypothetical protein